jgi:uncharacterized protein YrrD
MDHPRPGFRYIGAKELEDGGAQFAGMPVKTIDGQQLGHVEGFIVNILDGTPRHIVVSAGWFIHKHFLLPIGYALLSGDNKALTTELTKDRVSKFPGFSKSEFEKLNAKQMAELDQMLASNTDGSFDACYGTPVWWSVTYYRVPAGDRR